MKILQLPFIYMNPLNITIDVLPISSNHDKIPVLINGMPRLIKSNHARNQKKQLEIEINLRYGKMLRDYFKTFDLRKQDISIGFNFYFPNLYLKDGSHNSKIPDNTNLIKTIEDCIFKVAGINDRSVVFTSIARIRGKGPRAEINILIEDRKNNGQENISAIC